MIFFFHSFRQLRGNFGLSVVGFIGGVLYELGPNEHEV